MKIGHKKLLPITDVSPHILFWLAMVLISLNSDFTTSLAVPDSLHPDKIYYRFPINFCLFYTNYFLLFPTFRVSRTRWRVGSVLILVGVAASLEALIDGSDYFFKGNVNSFATFLGLFGINVFTQSFYWSSSSILRLSYDKSVQLRNHKELKLKSAETELALLKSQLNPHLLFNSLNALYISSYEFGDRKTANGIGLLSNLLRYLLYDTDEKYVPLEAEIDCMRDFIELQRIRYLDDVNIEFEMMGDTSDHQIAPFIFINLVENAFKHGISPDKVCNIKIQVRVENGRMALLVENDIFENSPDIKIVKSIGGIGLDNLKRRLELLYPDSYSLHSESIDGRYKARIELG